MNLVSDQPDIAGASVPQLLSPHVVHGVLESLRLAVVVFDRRLQITYRNEMARTLFAQPADVAEVLEQNTLESQYESWSKELRACVEQRRAARFEHVSFRQAERPPLLLNITCTPLIDPDTGQTLGGTLLAEDVTASVSMAKRLAVSERLAAVGKLAARVAHELNNPLDGIQRYISLAARVTGHDPSAAGRYLEEARKGLGRMIRIVGQLLEFSRSAHASIEEGDINKVIDEAIRSMDEQARAAGVTVVCNYDQAVFCQPAGNLFQVFCNLVRNALDAMPDGGVLTVTTRTDDRRLVITFEDTGVGLPPDAERIFDAFYTTKPAGKGTGLGLAICREIVERYNGTITGQRRPAGGSVFVLTIPLEAASPSPIQRMAAGAKTTP